MSYFESLIQDLPPEKVGHKFANLGRLAGEFMVPKAVCVTTEAFMEALGKELLLFLEKLFEDLEATVGCFLLDSVPELDKVMKNIKLPEQLESKLKDFLIRNFGNLDNISFAVRSSGTTEDSTSFSFAGVYETVLDVKGFDGICNALEECWRSFYKYTAVAARLRAGQFEPDPLMSVIIQEMVNPDLAGVAFSTKENSVIIEYVQGRGDALVSGTITPKRYTSGGEEKIPEHEYKALSELCGAVTQIRELYGYDVDVEWAWANDHLYILQVRPVTAQLGGSNHMREAYFSTAALYLDSILPKNFELGECREIYTTYVSKRAEAHRIATKYGNAVGKAYVISFNGLGLTENREKLKELLHSSEELRVVLDISNTIRQVIIEKEKVFDYLIETFGLNTNLFKRHTIIARDFIGGQFGFISKLVGEKGLLVEYSREGLLKINRGIANCERISVLDVNKPFEDENIFYESSQAVMEDFMDALPQIFVLTKELNKIYSGIQLEWVLEKGVPYFVDYSRESQDLAKIESNGSVIIASGTAYGPVFKLDKNEMLQYLSIGPAVSVDKYDEVLRHDGLQELVSIIASMPEKPIIFVKKPYAILSSLFEYVAGFVFAEGSLLCHLAILLREKHLPAIIIKTGAPVGSQAIISDGQLTIY